MKNRHQLVEVLSNLPEEARFALIATDQQFIYYNTQGKEIAYHSPQSVRNIISSTPTDSGWFKSNVIRFGCNSQKWFVELFPKMTYLLHLGVDSNFCPVDEKGNPISTGEIITITINLPQLVGLSIGTDRYLWAIKGEVKPDALLYYPPLPSVFQDGKICTGTERGGRAKPIPIADGENLKVGWDLWWTGIFNNHLTLGRSKKYGSEVRKALWAYSQPAANHKSRQSSKSSKSRSKVSSFPEADLVPLIGRTTLEDAVQEIVGEKVYG